MLRMKKPPCATWSIWRGPEIEGEDDLGIETLFFRQASPDQLINTVKTHDHINRYWLCEDLSGTSVQWAVQQLLGVLNSRIAVCFLINAQTLKKDIPEFLAFRAKLPRRLHYTQKGISRISVYYKLEIPSVAGDHICVGKRYFDAIIKIPDKQMRAIDYTKDVRIV